MLLGVGIYIQIVQIFLPIKRIEQNRKKNNKKKKKEKPAP